MAGPESPPHSSRGPSWPWGGAQLWDCTDGPAAADLAPPGSPLPRRDSAWQGGILSGDGRGGKEAEERRSRHFEMLPDYSRRKVALRSQLHTPCAPCEFCPSCHTYNDSKGLHIRLHNRTFYYTGLEGMQNIFNTAVCA